MADLERDHTRGGDLRLATPPRLVTGRARPGREVDSAALARLVDEAYGRGGR